MTLPRDMPDDYLWLLGGDRALMQDQAELAARIAARSVYDRRGQVVWFDRAEHGLGPWLVSGSGAGNGVEVVASPTYFGPYALQMTAGSTISAFSELTHWFAPAELNRWGIEVAIAFPQTFLEFDLFLYRFDGAKRHVAWLFVDPVNGELSVETGSSGMPVVGTIGDLVDAAGLYHNIKLVADFENDLFVRVLFDQQEIDLSGYDLTTAADTSRPAQQFLLDFYGRQAHNDKAWLGSAILTVGEP